MSSLPPVLALSDSEGENDKLQPAPSRPQSTQQPPAKASTVVRPTGVKQLRRSLERACGCSSKCLQPFGRADKFQNLLCFRKRLFNMTKLDQDNFAGGL